MDSVEVTYVYARSSACVLDPGGARLELATSGGIAPHPWFFHGAVAHPRQMAQALLLVAKVARTRFYEPPNTKERLEAKDPLVVAEQGRLRFEALSVCCGVYVRLDLLPAALGAGLLSEGTTNVDFNAPMRQALGRVTAHTPMQLSVGANDVVLRTGDGEVVERKVPLPDRWVRGLAQVQVDLAGMGLRHELGAVAARRFLQSLPATRNGREVAWAVPSGDPLRIGAIPAGGAVGLTAPSRLRIATDLGPAIRGLRAYGPLPRPGGRATAEAGQRSPEASAWEVQLDDARLWIALSPEVFRGFSGEGGTLNALALGLPGAEDAALGRSGFDLADGRWFSRDLPFDHRVLGAGQPRLRAARALVEADAVTLDADAGRGVVATDGAKHTVRYGGDVTSCTCPWFAKHRDERGPCKHVLAVLITRAALQPEVATWPAPT